MIKKDYKKPLFEVFITGEVDRQFYAASKGQILSPGGTIDKMTLSGVTEW